MKKQMLNATANCTANGVRWRILAALVLLAPSTFANTQYETVTFIGSDGVQFVNYTTTRSDAPTYTVHLDKTEFIENYLYINPNEYTFDNTKAGKNKLTFAQGDYALINQGRYDDDESPQVVIDGEGIYTLNTWRGDTQEDGHYGFWNAREPFANFAAVWGFPDHFELNDYQSNKPGEWIKRNNTLTFLSANTNDLTFQIRYSPRIQRIYAILKEELKELDAVELSQTTENVKLTIRNEILFDTGEVEINAQGLAMIADLATQLRTKKFDDAVNSQNYAVVIAGHTGDVPIRGALAQSYPTNWELSAHRSLNVVHALIASGINPELLQSHAYGAQQPKVPNTDAANRRINRRTEITISPN